MDTGGGRRRRRRSASSPLVKCTSHVTATTPLAIRFNQRNVCRVAEPGQDICGRERPRFGKGAGVHNSSLRLQCLNLRCAL